MATEIIKGKAFKRLLDAKQVSPKAIQYFDEVVLNLANYIKKELENGNSRITDEDVSIVLSRVISLDENEPEPEDI